MIVELLSVGTELLLGNIVNTNASYLSEKLALLGISVYFQTTVGDNRERLKAAIELALQRSDMVIMTGGLGPTNDDLSKETAAECFGLALYEDECVKEEIIQYFRTREIEIDTITENNWKQAMVPQGAKVLHNPNGTAPGLILEKDNKRIVLLPGPPNECKPMYKNELVPYLQQLNPGLLYSVMVKIVGMGESAVATKVHDLLVNSTNPTVAPYAKTGEVHLRVTAKADTEQEAKEMMKPVLERLREEFGNLIYTTDEKETLEQNIVTMLQQRRLTIATAESCTGGKLAARLTDVPGVSDVFKEGYITYANEVKVKLLGVKDETIKIKGVVSEEVAKEMSQGVKQVTGADVGIAVTGIAGPGGGSDKKPVGLVYIGCSLGKRTVVKRFRFHGNRTIVRESTVQQALVLLRALLLEHEM